MLKTNALILLSLLVLTACSNNSPQCGKREPYTGTTYKDAIMYCGSLERVYDSCSKQ